MKQYHKEVMKPTNDDWYPSYGVEDPIPNDHNHTGGFAKLSTFPLSNGTFRVCVWGADDFGMERDFKSKSDANRLYKKLSESAIISKDICESHGMARA